MKFLLLTTGGTIDSYSDLAQDGNIVPCKESIVPKFLRNLKPYFSFTHKAICQKDSRDVNASDIAKILNEIKRSKEKYVLITHGTYTMPSTARALQAKIGNTAKDKVIIFTGSMSTLIGTIDPLGGLVASDGSFSLGFAIASFQTLKPGIYLCMNGKVFLPEKVKKNTKSLRFFEEAK